MVKTVEDWVVEAVQSSTIKTVGHNSKTNDLFVEFQSGDQYMFFDVPEHEFESFLEAESKGIFFAEEIKDEYDFQKLVA